MECDANQASCLLHSSSWCVVERYNQLSRNSSCTSKSSRPPDVRKFQSRDSRRQTFGCLVTTDEWSTHSSRPIVDRLIIRQRIFHCHVHGWQWFVWLRSCVNYGWSMEATSVPLRITHVESSEECGSRSSFSSSLDGDHVCGFIMRKTNEHLSSAPTKLHERPVRGPSSQCVDYGNCPQVDHQRYHFRYDRCQLAFR